MSQDEPEKERTREARMEKGELRKLQDFLRRSFGNDDIRVAADPKMARAHYSLSLLHLGAGRVGDAVASLNRAIDADPGYQAALVLRGDVARQRGQACHPVDDLAAGLECRSICELASALAVASPK